jgi:tetratricopeptide (TPR) repeat protein
MKTSFVGQKMFFAIIFFAFFFGVNAQDKTKSKRDKEYYKASLAQKYELNKKWVIEEVLPALSGYETIVDDKFAGVKSFGELVAATDFNKVQDIDKLTSSNPDYWRAVMEMEPQNQLIPATKVFMLVSQGYFDYASRYVEMLTHFSRPENEATRYLEEFTQRMKAFDDELNAGIAKGIAEHDNGHYDKAIKIYNELLKSYPNSAWALYEVYYSKNTVKIKSGTDEPTGRKDWDVAKIGIYKCDPLYNMDVRASNSKEGYLLFRRQEISKLFKFQSMWVKDVYTYADIALDLGVKDFAAQLFWISFTFTEDDVAKDKALHRYLYTLERLGVPQWKSQFKGDYDVIFKSIDEERQKAMEDSFGYKAFKK